MLSTMAPSPEPPLRVITHCFRHTACTECLLILPRSCNSFFLWESPSPPWHHLPIWRHWPGSTLYSYCGRQKRAQVGCDPLILLALCVLSTLLSLSEPQSLLLWNEKVITHLKCLLWELSKEWHIVSAHRLYMVANTIRLLILILLTLPLLFLFH